MTSIKEIQHLASIKEFRHLKIPLQDLQSATNDFADSKCIGHGGFGKVYEGEILLSGVLTMVAIKRLNTSFGQGTTEFRKEIMMLSQYKHQNLVSLLGFCDEGGESLLVYEYLSKKSLDLYLSHPDLSWHNRLAICHGAAKGLKFLHEPAEGSQQRVLHCDIKSANILLNDNLQPKISDFGLSKLGPANQQFSFLFSNAVGTRGYCDPLYEHTGLLTKESDVYSFGVVLFEVLCGRLAYVLIDYNDIRISLTALARKCYEEKKLDTIIHSGIRETISPKSLERFSAIAYECLNIDRAERPSMAKVVSEIEIAYYYQLLSIYKKSLLEFPSKEIEVATENFKKSFGESQYGHMYTGKLSISGKPTAVVVKRFAEHSGVALHDFFWEVYFLCKQPHPNHMSVVGYCDEEKEKIIVYEYPERGRLDEYISRRSINNATCTTNLTWLQRLKICIDAAQGLYHLHRCNGSHSEFKSANILLDDKWVARVFNFVIYRPSLAVITDHAYKAPEHIIDGVRTKEADVYSLGMVLFEVLCGRLCTEEVDGEMLSSKLIKELYENKKLADQMVDPGLKEQKIRSYSVDRFSTIAYRCLLDDPKERPSMDDVIKELEELMRIEILREDPKFAGIIEKLEFAIKYQEFDSYEYEEFNYEHWKHKLSFDLEDLIKSLNFIGANVTEKIVLWLLHKGIFIGKKFVSISDNGVSCELISARAFLYPSSKEYEWESSSKFRFSEAARIPNKEKLNIRCRISTSLSPGIMYAASLVFSFQREPQIMHDESSSSHLMTLNWKCEGLYVVSTHFAEQTKDGWMKVRLWHFVHGGESSDFDILLDKISYFEEDEWLPLLIHGIEFEPAKMKGENERLEDVSISDEDGNWKKWIASDYEGIIQRSDTHLEYTSQTPPKKLYLRLCAGILIENGQKWFSLCKSTGGKCHMLPATEVFTNDAHFIDFDRLSLPESRFNEVIQLRAVSSCSFECELDPDMFSRGHVYACYLVFKFAEPHVWNHYTRLVRTYCRLDTKEIGMLFAHLNSRETVINIPTIIPKNHDGSHDSQNMPTTKDLIMPTECMDESVHNWMRPRNDGWMEVILSKSLHNLEDHKSLSVTLNSQESDFYGIIVQGIEFRPVQRNILIAI